MYVMELLLSPVYVWIFHVFELGKNVLVVPIVGKLTRKYLGGK